MECVRLCAVIKLTCLSCQWICRQAYLSYERCAWLLISYCAAVLMLQPQVKRRRMWSRWTWVLVLFCQKQCLLGLWRLLTQEPLWFLPCARSLAFGVLDINNTFSVKVKGFGMSFRTYIVLTIYHLIVVLMNVVFVGWPKVQGMLSALSWRNRERSVCSGCRISWSVVCHHLW